MPTYFEDSKPYLIANYLSLMKKSRRTVCFQLLSDKEEILEGKVYPLSKLALALYKVISCKMLYNIKPEYWIFVLVGIAIEYIQQYKPIIFKDSLVQKCPRQKLVLRFACSNCCKKIYEIKFFNVKS